MQSSETRNVKILTDILNFGYTFSQEVTDSYFLHCHNFYEVYLFLEGDVDYLVEGQKYKPTPNSMLLLAPHVFHGVRINTDSPYRRFSMHFHPDILSPERRAFLLSAFPSFEKNPQQKIYYEHTERFYLPTYFEAFKACADRPDAIKEQQLPIYVEALLSQIVSMCETAAPAVQDGASGTVSRIIWYLNQHLGDEISLDLLSERFFISKHHLNKVFKKATGTTVFDYLLHKRVIAAQQLLISGSSAQEAALASGFKDYSSFYRSYTRILKHSPLCDRGVLPSLAVAVPQKLEALPLPGDFCPTGFPQSSDR